MKRWPLALFLCCWLSILLAPPLRQMFWMQLAGTELSSKYGTVGYGGWAYGPFWIGKNEPDFVLQEHSNDVRVLAVELENKFVKYSKPEKPRPFFKQYDQLINRYPHQSWLLARRLLHTIAWIQHDRLGGELDDAYAAQRKSLGEASPERKKTKPNFTPAELNQALNLARRGQKMEPDNAFYDWVEAYLLFASWNDNAAWPIIKRASHKPRFDKHDREWAKAAVFWAKDRVGRPLLLEELIFIHITTYDYWLGQTRYMGRIITWERMKASRRGKHQTALDISGDFARLMFKAAQQSYLGVEMGSLSSIGRMALRGDDNGQTKKIKSPPEEDPHRLEKYYKARAQLFADYANQHGRRALANEMMSASVESGKLMDVYRRTQSKELEYGMEPRPLIHAISIWWAAGMLLLLLATLLVLWLALSALLRWLKVPNLSIQQRDRMKTCSAGVLIAAFFLSLGLWMGVGWQTTFYIGFDNFLDKPWLALSLLFFCFSLVQTIAFTDWFCERIARLHQEHKQEDRTDESGTKDRFHQRFKYWQKLQETRWVSWSIGLALDITAGALALWWICLLTGIVESIPIPADSFFHFWPDQQFNLTSVHPLWALSAFMVVMVVRWTRFLFLSTIETKPRVAYQLRLLQQTFGAFLLTGSVAYCLLLLVSIPLRARANEQMNQIIERGEVALLLENYNTLPKTK
ncbi:MAG TPA: hypothetical protein VGB77_18995 [Abditibacteriaceae bacterium]